MKVISQVNGLSGLSPFHALSPSLPSSLQKLESIAKALKEGDFAPDIRSIPPPPGQSMSRHLSLPILPPVYIISLHMGHVITSSKTFHLLHSQTYSLGQTSLSAVSSALMPSEIRDDTIKGLGDFGAEGERGCLKWES